jgi:hypothetical protein
MDGSCPSSKEKEGMETQGFRTQEGRYAIFLLTFRYMTEAEPCVLWDHITPN